MYLISLLQTRTNMHIFTSIAEGQMQIIRKLNQRGMQILAQLIWLMPLSLSVCVTHPHPRPSFLSVSLTRVRTQKHLHKRKSDCFNFHPCPLFSLSHPLSFLSRRFTCSLSLFFSLWLFYAETVLLCRPPLTTRPVTAQTQLTGGGGAA